MELKFVDVDLFEAVAERRIHCEEERFLIKAPSGGKIWITPGMSVHRDLTILGTDWIPVRPDGLSTLQQMTHTPLQFLGKARNIVQRDARCWANAASQRTVDASAVLVGGNTNYYHFLVDNLPRLLMARKYGELDGRGILINADLTRFERDALEMLGIDDARLIRVEADEAVRVREVCVPNMLAGFTVVHPAVPRLIREALPIRRGGAARRIYLCRQDGGTRQLSNERELTALLERFGFERHMPSQMSLRQQMDACADAEAIVAVHGAALASMLFCPPQAQVIEIFSPAHPASFFLVLAHVCGLAHSFIPASLVDPQAGKSPLFHDWEVDLDAMEQLLWEKLGD